MKKESPRSLRLTPEALAALQILAADNPGTSQPDIINEAIIEHAKKRELAPVIRFGLLDPQQLPPLQLETALAERRLREVKQQVLRVRPQDKTQAEKLSALLGKLEAELGKTKNFRIALAKLARLGHELTAEDSERIRAMIVILQERSENSKCPPEQLPMFQTAIKALKTFIVEV